jgi:hypothetical protein
MKLKVHGKKLVECRIKKLNQVLRGLSSGLWEKISFFSDCRFALFLI